MKPIQIILTLLLSLTLVSAVTVYSGEPTTIGLEKQFEYYSVVGNSTAVELEVVQHTNNSVTIIPNKYMNTDSFEIIFFDSEKETITVYQSSGGGGSGGGTRTVYRDNNITKYVDNEVIKEVPGETISVDKEIIKGSKWTLVWFALCILIIAGLVVKWLLTGKEDLVPDYRDEGNENDQYRVDGGYEKNE